MAQEISNGLNIFSELREIKADYEKVCDENATLRAELEEANKLVVSLENEVDVLKSELGLYTGRQ